MSSVWDLHIEARALSRIAVIQVSEFGDEITLEVQVPGITETMVDVTEDNARKLRDWLSWWLGEGEEPE